MIVIDEAVISDDLLEQFFVCDIQKCKGACCVEGDLGAPLEQDELDVIEAIYPEVEPYLSAQGKKAIEEQGPYILDEEGEFSTTTVNGKECAFAIYDEKGILKCGIEQAYQEGKISFQKPVSCHLYPVRITTYDTYDALNYDRWHICSPACDLGAGLRIPVYQFVKAALIRKYGSSWYSKLEKAASEHGKPVPGTVDK